MADWKDQLRESFNEGAKPRPGERVFTLRHHPDDGWLAFAHCSWCTSSFTSIGIADVEGKAALGWQPSSNAAVVSARENLADHEKHCSKKPADAKGAA